MSLSRYRARIAQAAFNTPIAMHPAKADIMMRSLASEIMGQQVHVNVAMPEAQIEVPERHAGQLGRTHLHTAHCNYEQCLRRTANGVGVIAVEGTLIHKGGWIDSYSGETSYQGLAFQIEEAIGDDTVKAVVFEFDSFGGEVAGCADLGALIADLSALKPTLAIVNDYAFSAAYWLASQCRQIVLPEAGQVGSIGVIWMHQNIKEALAQAGVEITILTAGAHKADGHPFDALPADVRETIEAELAEVGKQFAKAVGAGRGKTLDAKAALATEAKTFMGNAAVKAGLADATARPMEAFSAFVSEF